MSNPNRLLELDQLSACIGRQQILSNISLQVGVAECLAIVGGSGAGKSSLLRCVMGLYRPALPVAGRLWFRGEYCDFSQRGLKPTGKVRPAMAFVPQNPQAGLDPLKTLAVQWQQALRCAGKEDMPLASQYQLLVELGLEKGCANEVGGEQAKGRAIWQRLKTYPHQWSQGMQQRLLIAFALLAQPELLILDEPTSALDPLIAAKTMSYVMRLAQQKGIAVLIVTHDLAMAARFAQRVAIMSQGAIAEQGSAEQILTNPSSNYGQLLVANRHWPTALNPQRA